MSAEFLVVLLVLALGTYLMRAVPLLSALPRREAERERAGGSTLLRLAVPAIMVALLVTALLPAPSETPLQSEAFRREVYLAAAALVPTTAVALRTDSLGLTVVVGVASYWLISLAFG